LDVKRFIERALDATHLSEWDLCVRAFSKEGLEIEIPFSEFNISEYLRVTQICKEQMV
jgi:hypothetical protein